MPNQMIALQARGGRVADPARITAQYANMMTAKRQAEAAQSQSALARQTMANNQASETRAQETQLTAQQKAKFDYTKGLFAEYTNRLAKIDAADKTRYSNLRQQIIQDIPNLENELPTPDEWNDKSKFLVLADAEKFLRYKYGTPVASTAINDRTGQMTSITAGGIDPRAEVIGEVAPQNATPAMPSAEAPTAAPESNPFAPDAPPANTAAENVNSLGLVVASARETGVIAQKDVDKLLSIAAPGSAPKLMGWLKQNNIQIAPNAPGVTDNQMRGAPANLPNEMTTTPMAYDGQTPQSQYADLRGPAPQSQTAGLRGAPPMEQTMAQSQGRIPFIARREAQAPAETPEQAGRRALLGRSSPAEEAAKAQATKAVELQMAPEIAKATKTAERAVELKSTAAKAKYATEGVINEVVDRINTIDELLRDPNRFSIVGAIEGNLPRLLQTGSRADAQAAFDKIKNTATLTSLIDMRKSTETGASPVGANPTDRDARIVEQAASKLIQTGQPAKFDAELIDMRRKLYRTFQSAQREYDGVYGEVLKDTPGLRLRVPTVADRYISTKDAPKQKTSPKTPTSRLSAGTRAKYGL